jgi:polysaccharide deacetylase family protein (PEP-CTERM system associated)
MRNALTIDVEDWYHPELVQQHLPAGSPAGQVQESTGALLALLRQRGIKATFFVLGEVAERYPSLIESIAAEGHELACHGMSHRPLWQMAPDEFRAELEEFARTMQRIVPSAEIVGFRAPTFSLDNRTRWALGILADLRYHYDSSIFPVRNPVYGVSGGPLAPYRPSLGDVARADAAGPVVEFPMSVCTCAGLRVPVCGGFYLRALPFSVVQSCLRQINQRRPFVLYAHPWETHVGTPRLGLPLLSRWVTYYNIGAMLQRLEMLLDEFSFAPMREVLKERGDL